MEGLCAASSGHLLVGRWGTRLDPRQKLTLRFSPCSSKAEKAGFRILDVPKNGGQSGFLSFGRGPSSNCRKGEAILNNLGGGCLDIPHPKEEAASVLANLFLLITKRVIRRQDAQKGYSRKAHYTDSLCGLQSCLKAIVRCGCDDLTP